MGSMKDLLGDTPYPASPGYARGSETSKAAAESMKPSANKLRTTVLLHIASKGMFGSTCDEAEVALSMAHQTCSARFTELKSAVPPDIVALSKINNRKTRSGRAATVYVAKMFAP